MLIGAWRGTMRSATWVLLLVTILSLALNGCGPRPSPTATLLPPTWTPLSSAPTSPLIELPDLLARLHWLGRASFRLDGPPTIYFDPVSSFEGEAPQADIILISHSHSDHYSPSSLKRISGPETVIIAPQAVATLLPLDGVPGKVRALRPAERTTVGAVEIETTEAYNIGKSYHLKESGNLGFIVTLHGRRIYFAGDTDLIPEMADIHADVAMLPVGGTYTMDAKEAAQAVAAIKPEVVVPMHTLSDRDVEQFRDLCNCDVIIMNREE